MEFGASIFFTDYSITPAELALAMEERGFDSVWAAEHSHIPVPRRTRADSELGKLSPGEACMGLPAEFGAKATAMLEVLAILSGRGFRLVS
jgi:alkanesulfonate monooxygenase SsuD/methylene tetrahydromethanopterin reductase-like flavin-dependent oxidoreductase (luciferase family)